MSACRCLSVFRALLTLVALQAITAEAEATTTGGELRAVDELRAYLVLPPEQRRPIASEPFATVGLSEDEAETARRLLVDDWRRRVRDELGQELSRREIIADGHRMKFEYKVNGKKPRGGRSLFISMHGGGGAPAAVNDQQWRNQQSLYEPAEGVYVAPRAPTDNWNLWHESHIDALFDRLIQAMVVVEDVNPDRVYLLGYSAGGDGVYQLAPRMADRWAAAAMMAGHPNESTALGLRNVPFAIHVGERDGGYDRNKVAAEWKEQLAKLRSADPEGYLHHVEIHPGKGHWMDREDASAIPWMSQFTRNPFPKRVVWKQDDVTHTRFYWLAVDKPLAKERTEIIGEIHDQEIRLQSEDVPEISVRLCDAMLELDQPIRILAAERIAFEGVVPRTIAVMVQTLQERGDPAAIYSGEVTIDMSP